MVDDPIKRAAGEAARHFDRIREQPVSGAARSVDVRRHLEAAYRFDAPCSSAAVLDDVARMLSRGTVHSTHPAYFGLYNPGVLRSAIAASTLVAAYDPQAATHAHGMAAIEIEQHLLRFLASSLGLPQHGLSAHFTSGGQEANTEAVAVAIAHRFPETHERGLRALPGDPCLYLSAEAHHSFEKAAGVTGLGRAAVRRIEVDGHHRLEIGALARRLAEDRARGLAPFLLVGTAGATSSGAIDPLDELASFAEHEGLFFHVDAAFGGAATLSPRLRTHLRGIERADSITWDAHKWLQMPFGTGMFFTRHEGSALAAFGTESPYMPRAREGSPDPFSTSLQWSRRASGLPLFVALAELGVEGFAAMVEHMTELGDALRSRLVAAGFRIVNRTPLPVVAFTHPRIDAGERTPGDVARAIHRKGRAWIAPTDLADGRRVLRACICNFRTEERDLDVLMEELSEAIATGPAEA